MVQKVGWTFSRKENLFLDGEVTLPGFKERTESQHPKKMGREGYSKEKETGAVFRKVMGNSCRRCFTRSGLPRARDNEKGTAQNKVRVLNSS